MLPLRRAAAGAGAGRMVLCAGRALLLPTHPPPRRHLVLTPCLPHVLHFTSSTTPMKATSTSTLRRRRPLPQQPHAACFCSKPKDGEDDLSPPSTPPSTPASSSSSGSPQPPRIDIPGVHYATKRLAIVYTCKVRLHLNQPFPPSRPTNPSLPPSLPPQVCETRSTKAFSQQAYDHGVVLVRCPGCDNLHLIVDRYVLVPPSLPPSLSPSLLDLINACSTLLVSPSSLPLSFPPLLLPLPLAD